MLLEIVYLSLMLVLIFWRYYETFEPDKKKEKGVIVSPWTLRLMVSSFSFAVFLCLLEHYILRFHRFNLYVFLAGILVFAFRIFLKLWVLKTLGAFWSIQVEIRERHPLITSGPYKYMRHPSYLATMLELTAFCLISQAYYTLIYVWIVHFCIIWVRVVIEEKSLTTKFGSEYSLYKRKTFAFFPGKGILNGLFMVQKFF